MNNNIKILGILFFLLLVSSTLVFADSGEYSITNVMNDITVEDNSQVTIIENITYDIYSQVNGVYRVIPLDGQQSIEDISVETPGYYNEFEVINSSGNVTIKVWLYEDENKLEKINPGKIEVIYHYKFNKAFKVYNDIAELQYMSWGNGWNSSVDLLVTRIHLPGNINNCQYWNNPENIVSSVNVQDNTLITQYKHLDKNQNVEQRIIMPKEYVKSTEQADVINKDAKDTIIDDQNKYFFIQNLKDNMGYLFVFIAVVLIIGQILIFLRYGRDKKSVYSNTLQSQIPTNHSPVFVNALFNDNIGEVNSNAYNAVLLNLINKNYFKVISTNSDDTVIKQTDKSTSNLKQYELDVHDYVSKFKDSNSHISFRQMSSYNDIYYNFMQAWNIDIKGEISQLTVRRYYDERGHDYSIYLSIFSIIIGTISLLALIFLLKNSTSSIIGIISMIILIIVSIIIFILPSYVMGCWTTQGREFHDKWTNFKRYITDYSLIKEYPPDAIQVWGEIMVYATALGCSEQVSKNMRKLFDDNNISSQSLDSFDVLSLSYFGFYYMHIPHHIGNTQNVSDFGGSFGDIGGPGSGGFGGGGGGVF